MSVISALYTNMRNLHYTDLHIKGTPLSSLIQDMNGKCSSSEEQNSQLDVFRYPYSFVSHT